MPCYNYPLIYCRNKTYIEILKELPLLLLNSIPIAQIPLTIENEYLENSIISILYFSNTPPSEISKNADMSPKFLSFKIKYFHNKCRMIC